MKKLNFHIILTCFFLFILNTGCEKADLQRSSINDQLTLQAREIVECTECPMGDCCCAVELQNYQTSAALYLCGTSDGLDNCSGEAVNNCDSFSGGGQALPLDSGTPRRGFCLDPGQAFWIANTGGTTAYIYVTCQYDQTNPQTIPLTIPPYSRVYIGSNGECEIAECE